MAGQEGRKKYRERQTGGREEGGKNKAGTGVAGKGWRDKWIPIRKHALVGWAKADRT